MRVVRAKMTWCVKVTGARRCVKRLCFAKGKNLSGAECPRRAEYAREELAKEETLTVEEGGQTKRPAVRKEPDACWLCMSGWLAVSMSTWSTLDPLDLLCCRSIPSLPTTSNPQIPDHPDHCNHTHPPHRTPISTTTSSVCPDDRLKINLPAMSCWAASAEVVNSGIERRAALGTQRLVWILARDGE